MSSYSPVRWTLCVLVAVVSCVGGALSTQAADAGKSDFARSTIDLGIVVGDLAKSVKFYTDVIGMKEAPGFMVPADFGADAGLTDGKALVIRVLVLGEGDSATKLKLMEVPGASIKKSDNAFIHSQTGYRYLTMFVADGEAMSGRLKKAGVKPLAKGPISLPAGLPGNLALIVVRDPDGNLIELIMPKP
jgi:lactoylglutathione lyase